LSKLNSKFVEILSTGFWNANTRSIVPPEAAISRLLDVPNHEEITIGWLPSSGPFQIVTALAMLFNFSVLLILILVSVISDAVLLVMVVNNSFWGDPEIVMVGFTMEPQTGKRVFVGVGVGVCVSVSVGVGVDV
jgi:hypothetical protein